MDPVEIFSRANVRAISRRLSFATMFLRVEIWRGKKKRKKEKKESVQRENVNDGRVLITAISTQEHYGAALKTCIMAGHRN